MSKLAWSGLILISLTISTLISFNAETLVSFIGGSLFAGLIIFITLALIVKAILSLAQKNIKQFFLYLVIAITIIGAILLFLFLVVGQMMCLTAMTPVHFRTNTLTGDCNYGGGSSCAVKDPWYYKMGCESDAEKLEALKKSKFYDEARMEPKKEDCKLYCSLGKKELFCDTPRGGFDEISCGVLTSCDKISCS